MTEDTNLPVPSNVNKATEWLEGQIKKQIQKFKGKRNFYRKVAYLFTLSIAGLSAVTTVLIGVIQKYDSKIISITALVTSALTGFVTVWESLYASRKRWVKNNETLTQFYKLRDDITKDKLLFDNQLTKEQFEQFYRRYQEIHDKDNQGWRKDRDEET